MDSQKTTYKVSLVQRDGTITAGAYTSADGELPKIGDEIPADDHGNRARVTDLNPGDPVPIHADLLD